MHVINHKHSCISHTFLVKFWVKNQRCGLSMRLSLGVSGCMVWDLKSGLSVFLLVHSFLLFLALIAKIMGCGLSASAAYT